MRKLTAVFIQAILACAALSTSACGRSRESTYRSVFLSVPGVEEVTSFLYYEGHTGASLRLTNGRYLDIAEFDESVGTSTDHIGLIQIGDLKVFCSSTRTRSDVVGGGFNIVNVMGSSPSQLQLRNIGDVVSHYDEIYRYLDASLPAPQAGDLKEFDVGAESLWCSRGAPR
jgi:hypothetical protein